MFEMVPSSETSLEKRPLFVKAATAVVRLWHRATERHNTKVNAYLADVRSETAQTPGVIGRLASTVNSLQGSPPDGAKVTNTFWDEGQIVGSADSFTYTRPDGVDVQIRRTTSYDYSGTQQRARARQDDIEIRASRWQPQTVRRDGKVNGLGVDIEELAVRVYRSPADQQWAIEGLDRNSDRDDHPGSTLNWRRIAPEVAEAFLDNVFGQPRPSELPTVPQPPQ